MDKTYPTTELRRVRKRDRAAPGRHRKLPEKLSRLRQKLNHKAKQEPKYRFYTLYDRIYRLDTLEAAWCLLKSSRRGKAPGVDGVTIQQIVEQGEQQFVRNLHEQLRSRSYHPDPVRRVYIPKPDGRLRPLGIPTVKDRVVQMATLLILEPIFEADFLDCSYGFRPGRSAHQALTQIKGHLEAGYRQVYDADLKGYFDSIPHDKLMACLQMRIADRSVLKLIRMWLQAPIVEKDNESGQKQMQRQKRGTPQGGVISPLLANVYLHWLDKRFHASGGPARWANARLVRFADDFVILARYQGSRLTDWIEQTLEPWMGLTINRDKTKVVKLEEAGASLDFLGYTFRYALDQYGRGHRYLHIGPSKKAVARARVKLREMTGPKQCFKPLFVLIDEVSAQLRGWSQHFGYGHCRQSFRAINFYVHQRLTTHACRRSQRSYRSRGGRSFYDLFTRMGLQRL